ncbi:MAG: hypothetical protein KDA58_03895 [Planctomycetaceae bacterium]|nr:hypothetical protein [Planctomycetaceae bacterium]
MSHDSPNRAESCFGDKLAAQFGQSDRTQSDSESRTTLSQSQRQSERPSHTTAAELEQVPTTAPIVHHPDRMIWDEATGQFVLLDTRNAVLTLVHPDEDQEPAWSRSHWSLGGRPTDLANWGSAILIVDEAAARLRTLDVAVWPPQELGSRPIARLPSRLAASTTDGTLMVAHRWNWSLSLMHADGAASEAEEDAARIQRSATDRAREFVDVQLPFPPGLLLPHPGLPIVIVADAFQGNVCAVQTYTGEVLGRIELPVHGIRGMIWRDGLLLLTCQQLHAEPTTAENIASGNVIENLVAEVEFDPAKSPMFRYRHRQELGLPSHGAADPSGIAALSSGEVLIAAAGKNELLRLSPSLQVVSRLQAGQHPTVLAQDHARDRWFLLEQGRAKVRLLDASGQMQDAAIDLRLGGTPGPADRGEDLFFAANRSQFGWMTCASCHVDGHAIGRLADTFGDGTTGAPKAVLSLLGGRDANPWGWTGNMQTLHGQIFKSLGTTMHSPVVSAREVNDLAAYLHTLTPPPPRRDPDNGVDLIARGRQLFESQGCQRCHIPPLTYTSDLTYDVSLPDEHGHRKFNPPSLRGVSQRRGYLHDLRAPTLESVLHDWAHPAGVTMIDSDLQALVSFLESL